MTRLGEVVHRFVAFIGGLRGTQAATLAQGVAYTIENGEPPRRVPTRRIALSGCMSSLGSSAGHVSDADDTAGARRRLLGLIWAGSGFSST